MGVISTIGTFIGIEPTSKADRRRMSSKEKTLAQIKKGIWLYFWLLLFEGALRKWFLTPLSTPLLIVRDPVAIWLLFRAHSAGVFKVSSIVMITWVVTIVSSITALVAGHGSLAVAAYGARITLVQFPMIFLIGNVFNKQDVILLGKVFLLIAIPMTVLIGMQFYSPQSAWVNRGVGGDIEGAGFGGAMGYFRPPATFSFATGTVAFYGLLAGYVFYFWLDSSNNVKKWLLLAATGCLIASIPLSISRTLLFQVIISGVFATIIAIRNPKLSGKFILGGIAIAFAFLVLSNTSFFQTGTEAFTERLTTANQAEGGTEGVLLDRFLGGLVGSLTENASVPLFGYGIGLGTNAGAALLTGKASFLFNSELEWGRILGEMGILLGLIIVIIRCTVSFSMTTKSYTAMSRGNLLPWMLLSYGFLNVLQGQWAQPTMLGFAVFVGGITLAALKDYKPQK